MVHPKRETWKGILFEFISYPHLTGTSQYHYNEIILSKELDSHSACIFQVKYEFRSLFPNSCKRELKICQPCFFFLGNTTNVVCSTLAVQEEKAADHDASFALSLVSCLDVRQNLTSIVDLCWTSPVEAYFSVHFSPKYLFHKALLKNKISESNFFISFYISNCL